MLEFKDVQQFRNLMDTPFTTLCVTLTLVALLDRMNLLLIKSINIIIFMTKIVNNYRY